MVDKNDVEYLRLLKQHLQRAYGELSELKKKVDLKMIEIDQVEELVELLERKVKDTKKDT